MNYLAEILAFNNWTEYNSSIRKSDICLWHALMYIANNLNWPEEFNIPISMLISTSKLTKNDIYKSRNRLKQLCLLDFKERSGNQATVYQIKSIVSVYGTQNGTQIGSQMMTQSSTQIGSQSVNILKTKNQKLKTKESNLSTSLRSVEKLPKKFASKNFVNNEFENVLSKPDHGKLENAQFASRKPANPEKHRYGESKNTQFANRKPANPEKCKHDELEFADEKLTRPEQYKHDELGNAKFADSKPANLEKHEHSESKNAQFASRKPANPEQYKHDELKNAKFANEKPTNPEKHKHGEFKNVLLTSDEFAKLETEYGNDLPEIIEHLSGYIEMKGYKAKSHYLAIRKWVALAYREQKLHEAELAKREENLKQHKSYGGNSNYGENSDGNYESEVSKRARCTEFAHIKSTDGSDLSDTECEELRRECEEIHRSELEKWEREQAERKNFKPGPWRI